MSTVMHTGRLVPMLRQTLNFIGRHWPHLLLIIPGALLITIVHESAHAFAVFLQGGKLTQFVWLPEAGKWGYITYEFPDGAAYSDFAISFAPYLVWLLLASFAAFLSLRSRQLSYWKASLAYLWLFVIPLADIANTAFPYLAGRDNDFRSAFGNPSVIVGLAVGLFGILALIGGYHVQRCLYREDGLTTPSYLALSTIALAMILTLAI